MRFLALLLVLASATSVAAQSNSDRYLKSQRKTFIGYDEDFLAFAKTQQNELEFEIAYVLHDVASETHDYIDAASTLLEIYDTVDISDQVKITPIIKEQMSYYIKMTDLNIETVNHSLANTKVPALTVTADRMKKDMRDVRERLASLQNSLKP